MAGLATTSSGGLTLPELIRRIDPDKLARLYRAASGELGTRMVNNLRAVTRKKTGKLAAGWESRTVDDRTIEVRNPVRYARPFDEGSIPHVIRARLKRSLRFPSNGQIVFRTEVHHPGTRKEDVVKRGKLRTIPSFMEFLKTKITAAIVKGAQ